MKKKVLIFVLLTIIGASAVFAQRVGETVQVSGQTYRVESNSDGRMVLQLVPSLDGVWRTTTGSRVTAINGSSGTINSLGSPSVIYQDAINKGYMKVGDQEFRNLRSTGNLTWSGQVLVIDFRTNNRNVATGVSYDNGTITLSADGQTMTVTLAAGSATFTRQ